MFSPLYSAEMCWVQRIVRCGGLLLTSMVCCGLVWANDPLTELLQKAKRGADAIHVSGRGESSVTLVWLSQRSLSTVESSDLIDRAIQEVRAESGRYLKAQEVKGLKPDFLVKRLNIRHVPVDQGFTLNLKGLAQATRAPDKRALLESAKAATLFSYRGKALKADEQLKLICTAALSFLTSHPDEGVAVSVESLTTLTRTELTERCDLKGGAELLPRWARPDIEVLEDQSVRLVSRGLAQFGRAELELGPLSQDRARAHWSSFQAALLARGSQHTLSVSDQRCLRPPHAYEGRCIRLIIKTAEGIK